MSTHNRSVEWLLAGLMLAWGIGLMLPGEALALPQYRLLLVIAPEPVWAAWSVSVGSVRIIALYINGSYFRTPLIRVVCAIMGLIWWLVLGFLVKLSIEPGPIPAYLAWFPIFIGFEGYAIFRGAQDSYHTGALEKWNRQRI